MVYANGPYQSPKDFVAWLCTLLNTNSATRSKELYRLPVGCRFVVDLSTWSTEFGLEGPWVLALQKSVEDCVNHDNKTITGLLLHL